MESKKDAVQKWLIILLKFNQNKLFKANRESQLDTKNGANFLDDYSTLIVNDKSQSSSSPSQPIPDERTQTRLSISSKSSRSPSQSPHQPRRKFSAQIQCTPAKSYFPVEQCQQQTNKQQSPSPTTRRKTSMATFSQRERMSLANPTDSAENSSRKFTCPNLATVSQKEWKRNNMEKKKKQEQECDYALISAEQEPKLDGK